MKDNKQLLWINLILFVFLTQMGWSQTVLTGRVSSDGMPVINEEVMNLVTEEVVKTDSEGQFRLTVKEGDMLVIPSHRYEYFRKSITAELVKQAHIEIELIAVAEVLEEVIVKRDINPEDMQLVPQNQKQYTPAEKRLFTANSGVFDKLYRKQMKQQVAAERVETSRSTLKQWFRNEYFVERLHIPNDYIEAFLYYAGSHIDIQDAIKQKNKNQTAFLLSKYATSYLQLQKEEAPLPED